MCIRDSPKPQTPNPKPRDKRDSVGFEIRGDKKLLKIN
jgi:hypothetical protein